MLGVTLRLHTLRLHNNSIPIIPSCLMDKNFQSRLIHLSIDFNPLDSIIIYWIRRMGVLKYLASEESEKLLQRTIVRSGSDEGKHRRINLCNEVDPKPQKITKSRSSQSVSGNGATEAPSTIRKTKSGSKDYIK